MAKLNLVLVEPEIPQNTGNIARTCAATGASLHLVEPLGFRVDDRKLKRAGLDYWHLLDITYYESLNDFFEKTKGGNYFFFSTKGTHRHSDVEYPDNCYPTATSSTPTTATCSSARKPAVCPSTC